MSEGDPYVELRLRDEKRTTTTRHETRGPASAWRRPHPVPTSH